MRIGMALIVVLAGIKPAPADGNGWLRLEGDAIIAALAARTLGYADGTLQDFKADGQTLYGDSSGRWEVRGDRYCSQWPPSDRWDCHGVERRGLDIRFTDARGTVVVGRYVDLH